MATAEFSYAGWSAFAGMDKWRWLDYTTAALIKRIPIAENTLMRMLAGLLKPDETRPCSGLDRYR